MTGLLSEFKKLDAKKRFLLGSLLVASIIGIYFQAAFRPLSQRASRFKFQTDKYRSRLEKIKSKFPEINKHENSIQALNNECDTLNKKIKKMELKLPSPKDISLLLGEFTALAEKRGIKLSSLQQKTEEGAEYSRLFVEATFNSPYKKAIDYLKAIENVSPFMDIEKLVLSEAREKDQVTGVSAHLVVSILLGQGGLFQQHEQSSEGQKDMVLAREVFASDTKTQGRMPQQDLKLEGITFDPNFPTAIINNNVVRVGSGVGSLTVAEILPETVILTDGQEEYKLSTGK